MSGENGTNGTTPNRPVRSRDYCPDVAELRRLLGKVMGVASATQAQLAELIGCKRGTVMSWENGVRVSQAFAARLVELERKLKARKGSLMDEFKATVAMPVQASAAEPRSVRGQPLVANIVSMKADREHALVRFELKVPGEDEPRQVAEVLVGRIALERAMELLKLAL